MLTIFLRVCIFIGFFIQASFAVHAHEYTPAFLSLTEKANSTFAVKWKVDTMAGLNTRLIPEFPSQCQQSTSVDIETLIETEIHNYRLECTESLSNKTLTIAGLAGSKTDVLLRINYLSGESYTHRLMPSQASVVIPLKNDNWQVATTYTILGFEHILIGLDHLLFVLALLLLIRDVKSLILTITAFTIAHSLTLAATTLGWVTVASEPVEATIAISILFLAVQLAKQQRGLSVTNNENRHSSTVDNSNINQSLALAEQYPWFVAFSFGLLHGFGFAGVLSEIGLPEHALTLSLLFFNLGVEFGQLFFVALIFALGWAVKTLSIPTPKWWKQAIAYSIGTLSVVWIIERSAWIIA